MNESATAQNRTTWSSPLLHRIDGVELPTVGTWYVPGNHATVAFSSPRTLRRLEVSAGRASGAILRVSYDPERISVSVSLEPSGIALVSAPSAPADSPTHLEARAIGGRDPWTMSGEMFTATNVYPVSAHLTYHGIWRGGRDDRDYAWFVLAGVIGVQQRLRNGRTRFSLHLLAYGPDDHLSVRHATARLQRGCRTESHMVPA
jgi:hypothetical protein